MGIELVETKIVGTNEYRILLLGSKYTVYLRENAVKDDEEDRFAALASFDSLSEARHHIELLETKPLTN